MSDQQPTLEEAIKMVLPHASRDKGLPVLSAVAVRHDSVIATDRYTVAKVEVPTSVPEGEVVIIPLAIARLGVVALEGNNATLAAPSAVKKIPGLHDVQWATVPLPGSDEYSTYPNVDRIISDFAPAPQGESPGSFLLSTTHASKYAARHFPARMRAGGLHPMRIELGADALRPVRITFSSCPSYVSLWVPVRGVE